MLCYEKVDGALQPSWIVLAGTGRGVDMVALCAELVIISLDGTLICTKNGRNSSTLQSSSVNRCCDKSPTRWSSSLVHD